MHLEPENSKQLFSSFSFHFSPIFCTLWNQFHFFVSGLDIFRRFFSDIAYAKTQSKSVFDEYTILKCPEFKTVDKLNQGLFEAKTSANIASI